MEINQKSKIIYFLHASILADIFVQVYRGSLILPIIWAVFFVFAFINQYKHGAFKIFGAIKIIYVIFTIFFILFHLFMIIIAAKYGVFYDWNDEEKKLYFLRPTRVLLAVLMFVLYFFSFYWTMRFLGEVKTIQEE